jgi:beta-glucosidase
VNAALPRLACAGALSLLCAAASGTAAADQAPSAGQVHPALWPQVHAAALDSAATEAQLTRLMARMSLAEKVGQVIQADIGSIAPQDLRRYPLGSILAGGDPSPRGGTHARPRAWRELLQAFRRAARARPATHAPIPLLLAIDAPHGIAHVRGATIFPQAIGLGAAHDAALVGRIGAATAEEAAALGFNWLLTPTLAVPQNVRWGRTYEAWSSDPALVGSYAAALVQAVQRAHVAATAKHFIGDGATTDGIDQGDAAVDEQQLIAVHAPAFVSAIEAGVLSVMVSYSSWQGIRMHGNRELLTAVLKQRLGFDGMVIGDWDGHNQLEGCSSSSCPTAFNAGLDMFMAPDEWRGLFEHTLAQVRAGQISAARLDDAVRRVLRVKAALGLFAAPSLTTAVRGEIGGEQHRALARQAVRESLVLLKNTGGALPIRADAHVLVTGEGADDIGQQCGGWTLSWQGGRRHNEDFPHAQSIYGALSAALASAGGSAELSADGNYRSRPDVAVVVYGEQPYAEGLGDRPNLVYEDLQTRSLLARLRANHIPVVSVFLSGRPLQLDAELDASDAFVAAWLPGSEGVGVADVLIGDVQGRARHDFRGRLSYAWPTRFDLGYGLDYGSDRTLARLMMSQEVGRR